MTKTNPIAQLLADLEANKKQKKRKPPYRKPQSILDLEELNHADRRNRYPNQPNLAYLRFSDKTANDLTKSIVKYIELCGGFASRINNTGLYRPELGRFVKSNSKRGIADISAVHKSLSLSIEIKIGKDRMSEDQIKVQSAIERSGGRYFIARDFTTFKEWFDGL